MGPMVRTKLSAVTGPTLGCFIYAGGVKITAYNNHRSAPFLRALVTNHNEVYSLEGSRRAIQLTTQSYARHCRWHKKNVRGSFALLHLDRLQVADQVVDSQL